MPGWLIGVLIGGAVLIAATVVIVALVVTGDDARDSQDGDLGGGQTQGACGEVIEEPATMEPYHLEPGQPLPQPELPATSGPHSSTPLAAGIYTEYVDEAQAIHSMEHGYVVIWYDPETTPTQTYDALTAAVLDQPEVIVAPYDLQEAAVVFVAWERIQGCDPAADPGTVAQAASDFIASYLNAPNAPEPQVA